MKQSVLTVCKCKDGENRDSLTIQINKEGVFIPTEIISEFLKSESKNIRVTIPIE